MASTCAKREIVNSIRFVSLLFLIAVSGLTLAQDRRVVATRDLPAEPAAVINAFLSSDDLKAWWMVTRSLTDPTVGGVWSIAWDDWGDEKTHHSWTGLIEAISDNQLVISPMVMIEPGMPLLGPMRLELSVAPVPGGSRLTVSHGGYGYGDHWDEMYALVVNGWNHVLGDLDTWFRTYE